MSEFNSISDIIEKYYQALYSCDNDGVVAVFDPSARIHGYYEGELINQNLPQYLKLLSRLSSPEMIGENVNASVVSIDVSGDTAVVKAHYNFESLRYTDYLSCLRVDGDWQIVQKLFHHE